MEKFYTLAKLSFVLFAGFYSSHFSSQTYCNPTYPSGCTSWRITQVTIPSASFDNSFASGTCITGRDRTSVTAALTTGAPYTINITTLGWIACGMAIDFNNNGSFEDAGEKLYLSNYEANQTHTYSGSFTIPTTVAPGNYRMRVWNRIANSGNGTPADSACGTYNYGTWTDYTANITSLSTQEVEKKAIAKLYPNPASDFLNLESKEDIRSVEILDLSGKQIESFIVNAKFTQIQLSKLTAGTYTLRINTALGTESKKFIKK